MTMTLIKYPRTFHLPWSPGMTSDDKVIPDTTIFHGKEIIVTEKMDGENTTLRKECTHARSLDSRNHVSRAWVKQLHGQIGYLIPDGWRICGENLFAQHSIAYDNLNSYFTVFAIFDENNICLSWDDLVTFCQTLDLTIVPVLYRGKYDEKMLHSFSKQLRPNQEGYVVRVAEAFSQDNFATSVAKYVRANHVQTDQHWMHSNVVQNGLKK